MILGAIALREPGSQCDGANGIRKPSIQKVSEPISQEAKQQGNITERSDQGGWKNVKT